MSLNLLMDILPEYVNIDGEEYFIDTNFRNGIIFEKIAFSDIPIKNKVAQLLPIFYIVQIYAVVTQKRRVYVRSVMEVIVYHFWL